MAKKTAALYMESTEIAPEKSASEIMAILVRAGASQIAMDYADGKIVGLRFTITRGKTAIPFALPVRVEPVFQLLWSRRDPNRIPWGQGDKLKTRDREQAERVAWRQLLRWVQAQTAMMDVGMVEAAEVFMPYMVNANGQTLFQQFEAQGPKLLTAGTA